MAVATLLCHNADRQKPRNYKKRIITSIEEKISHLLSFSVDLNSHFGYQK